MLWLVLFMTIIGVAYGHGALCTIIDTRAWIPSTSRRLPDFQDPYDTCSYSTFVLQTEARYLAYLMDKRSALHVSALEFPFDRRNSETSIQIRSSHSDQAHRRQLSGRAGRDRTVCLALRTPLVGASNDTDRRPARSDHRAQARGQTCGSGLSGRVERGRAGRCSVDAVKPWCETPRRGFPWPRRATGGWPSGAARYQPRS